VASGFVNTGSTVVGIFTPVVFDLLVDCTGIFEDVAVSAQAGLPAIPRVHSIPPLSEWPEAQVWCSPKRHGTLSAVFKNQIDWLPLESGGVRPT
jgi:arsenical resistance protein ArsH